MTTVKDWLKTAEHLLSSTGIATARLDSLVLLEDCLGRDRSYILAHQELEISAEQERLLKNVLKQRAEHIPLAFVRGKTEFFGREFVVSAAVLEPRPESETMIELLKTLPDLPKAPRIADVGTGSGALGITAVLELTDASAELLEIDPEALKVAKTNVDLFTARATVKKSDLLAQSSQDFNVLLCNLPYVPDDHTINQAAMHEPRIAIFGGPDGLDVYRKLFEQVKKLPKRPLYILTEALPPSHEALSGLARAAGYELEKSEDFIQVFRFF